MIAPLVSIVMPVRNAEAYIVESLKSILRQTYSNLEILVINDGSSDRSLDLIRQANDPRIVVMGGKEELGITVRLNQGISSSNGKYIARMDADDICALDRIERQVMHMEANPAIAVLGTGAAYVDARNRVVGGPRPSPIDDESIKWRMITSRCLVHPSVMLRSDVIKPHGYSEDYRYAQDLELWLRLAAAGHRFANLPEILLLQRQHSDAVSASHREQQIHFATRALMDYIESEFGMQIGPVSVAGIINPPADLPRGVPAGQSPMSVVQQLAQRTLARSTRGVRSDLGDLIQRDVAFFALRYAFWSVVRPSSRFLLKDPKGFLKALSVMILQLSAVLTGVAEYLNWRQKYVRTGREILRSATAP